MPPATTGLVKEVVSQAHLQQANALVGLSKSSLTIAGPAIGAILVATGSPAVAIGIDSVTFLLSALITVTLRIPNRMRSAKASVLSDLRTGWREFLARPWAVAMVASFGLFQLSFFPASLVLGPVVANERLGGAPAWGGILSIVAAGAVIGGIVALRLRVTRPLVACQVLLLPAALLLLSLASSVPFVVIAVVALFDGISFSIGNTIWMTTLQRNVPDEVLSRISSFDWLGSVALNPVGYAVIGPLSQLLGVPTTLSLAALFIGLVGLGVILVPSVRTIGLNAPTDAKP